MSPPVPAAVPSQALARELHVILRRGAATEVALEYLVACAFWLCVETSSEGNGMERLHQTGVGSQVLQKKKST